MTYDEKGAVVAYKQQSILPKRFTYGAGLLTTAVVATQAHAAEAGIDLSGLTEQFSQLKTGVTGVIAVAITIAVVVVGWRWIKRAVFSL